MVALIQSFLLLIIEDRVCSTRLRLSQASEWGKTAEIFEFRETRLQVRVGRCCGARGCVRGRSFAFLYARLCAPSAVLMHWRMSRGDGVLLLWQRASQVRRADGSIVSAAVSPYPSILEKFCSAAEWEPALRLCRSRGRA